MMPLNAANLLTNRFLTFSLVKLGLNDINKLARCQVRIWRVPIGLDI
jgi:hypothetical protein